ncbi:MAG: adventurous gliding motility protein U, partial [Bdellovibrionaceae bacterium]|nr:adventurous gliding motility protein U [Pseudobdellovibrionaceae bacterium]
KVNGARLESEALKDLVVFFADIDDTQRTINYFSGLKIKNWKDYVERYGYYISDKGNREASREVFKYLIAQDPNSKKAFEYQYQIVQNYFFSKNSPEFKAELYRWVTAYNTKSNWYRANAGDAAFVAKSNQLREQTLRNYILQQHQTAQNSRAEFSQQAAEQGYKLYFQEFSQSPQSGDMHFYYGELLYDLKKFGEASNEYAIIVDQNLKTQFAERASQNLLLALEKSLPTDEDLQKKVGNSTQPIALDAYSERFIKAANQNLEKYPKSANAGEIRFRVGRLYYLTNNFDQAEKYFRDVVKLHPRTKIAEYSANLLLDIYSLRNDYNGLDQIGAELLANPDLANTKAGAD